LFAFDSEVEISFQIKTEKSQKSQKSL